MRYLVFDIECCDGAHICEFGYVIANENFEIIEKDVILINPEHPFNLSGRNHSDEIKLFFTNEEYYGSPTFPSKYSFIKSLIEAPDQIVIGHAIYNDIKFLKTACIGYNNLPPINFSFIDSQKVYEEFTNKKIGTSLENAEATLNLPKPEYHHRSDEDAKLTLELIHVLCEKLEVNIHELMKLYPRACGRSEKYNSIYDGNSLKDMLMTIEKNAELLSHKKRERCFKAFIEEFEISTEVMNSELCGTVFCFSKIHEKKCTKDTFVLIEQMYKRGCKYTSMIGDCDYYVASEQELMETNPDAPSRYMAAKTCHRDPPIKIITMDDLVTMLDLTYEELNSMDMPKLPKKKNKTRTVCYSSGKSASTIGDQLKAKGIDLLAMFS